uniref:ceramidase n=1 Tax=Cuerna arida TaxID=1464854 RepID=A0A1B6GT78_9HEMI
MFLKTSVICFILIKICFLLTGETHTAHGLSKSNGKSEKFDPKILLEMNTSSNSVEHFTQSISESHNFKQSDHKYKNKPHTKSNRLFSEPAFQQLEKELYKTRKERIKQLRNHVPSYSSPFQGCANESFPSTKSGKIAIFKIDLDAEPEDRWMKVLKQKRSEIKRLADFFEHKFGTKVINVVDKYISWLHQSLPHEYFMELKGIANWTGLSIGRVTLYNIFYEFFSICTSIVMEGNDGHMYHGRNLDFGLFMGWDAENHTWFLTEILRPLIIKVDFFKEGKPLYSAVSYAGFTGVLTGLKKGRFSLSVNERFISNGGYVGLVEWILGRRDLSWLGLLTRKVMQTAQNYQQAQDMLASTPLVAPVYFILAGNASHQGCIITRGRSSFDIWPLGSRHKGQSGDWYVVETNYDHWSQTPFYDHRREYAVQCMDQAGQQQPLQTLYSVLSTRPVLNKETTLTAVMDVSAGRLEVWERDCEDPCWPF